MAIEALFWISVGLVAYTYALYPVLIALLAGRRTAARGNDPQTPTVTVLIAARNEAPRIKARIENILEQDYPAAQLRVLVAVNASDDDTLEIARSFGAPVSVIAVQGDGKAAALAEGLSRIDSDVVVFADARQSFDRQAVRSLVDALSDPDVGCASGELEISGDRAGAGLYWRYEKAIRHYESRYYSLTGVTGAIYAARTALVVPPPPGTILDDVWVPLHIVKRGKRVILEPEAKAYDQFSTAPGHEFRRKVRTLAGNFQLMQLAPWITSPVRNPVWWQWVSHKVLRLIVPYALVVAFVTSILAEGLIFDMAVSAQVVFYFLAAIGLLWRFRARKPAWLSFPSTFVSMNWAAVVGFGVFLGGGSRHAWKQNQQA